MKGKSHTPEQIVMKLREADRLLASGMSVAEAVKQLEVSEWTYCRWRKRFVGMDKSGARSLKELEKENARLKRLLAEKDLDNSILKEALEGND